jgi:hypothetical protein
VLTYYILTATSATKYIFSVETLRSNGPASVRGIRVRKSYLRKSRNVSRHVGNWWPKSWRLSRATHQHCNSSRKCRLHPRYNAVRAFFLLNLGYVSYHVVYYLSKKNKKICIRFKMSSWSSSTSISSTDWKLCKLTRPNFEVFTIFLRADFSNVRKKYPSNKVNTLPFFLHVNERERAIYIWQITFIWCLKSLKL